MSKSQLTDLRGVGPALAAKFAALGVETPEQLVTYWPRRYNDYSTVTPTNKLRPGQVTVCGQLSQVKSRFVRRGLHITEAVLTDSAGPVSVVWFNQPYRAAAIKSGQDYYLSGNYELRYRRFAIQNPSTELKSDLPVNVARIVPIYKETKGLNSRQIRSTVLEVFKTLPDFKETLPTWLIKDRQLMAYNSAVRAMHFPADSQQLERAKHRLAFEEVFNLSLASQMTKRELQLEKALPIPFNLELAKRFVAELSFKLTDDQRRAVWQIFQDMEQESPMNRLLEGDVGSGKTVVAAMAALMVLAAGKQVAYMAPTELLARQHADTLHRLLKAHGFEQTVQLLVGSLTPSRKKQAHQDIKSGKARFIVGTQALIQDQVDMEDLALIIVDEQHRFGVDQRKALMLKAGHMPHVLSMTATPIPRSLALTLYGELDITLLKTKPAGRQPVVTELVPPSSQARLYEHVKQELAAGRQAFVVCPLIQESAVLDTASAEATYERLKKGPLQKWRLGLLHGKLKTVDKHSIMQAFVRHEIDVLVTTTVIEVGVDVPNASLMLIEGPERFGLAQLHQLRGRVGRGAQQSYCYLLLSDSKAPGPRLRALEASQDGFKLSEYDLKLRGPGAIYGTMQHGALDLRLASLSDTELITAAQKSAKAFLDKDEDLLKYPTLAANVARLQTITNLN